jgi:hypothetical protein
MSKYTPGPLDRLKHHVTGAIERGEKTAVVAVVGAKHTPGPWTYGRMDELNHGSEYSWVSGPVGCIAHVYPDREPTNDLANARLIAAAPELLAACKLALEHLVITDYTIAAQYVLTEAIKKAEGRND